jgi:hypothetical protein
MAGRPPKTDKWSAWENKQGKQGDYLLHVHGLVQVDSANKQPLLKPSPVRNPKVLNLDLSIGSSKDPSTKAAVWKSASHHEMVKADQYDKVDIRWDGSVIAGCAVLNDAEHHRHLAAMTQAANKAAAAGSGKKPAPAKKGAAKPGPAESAKKAPAKKGAAKPAKKAPAKKAPAKKAPAKKGAAKKGAAKKGAAKKGAAKKAPAKKGSAKKSAAKKTAAKKTAAKKRPAKKRPASRKRK